MIPSLISSRLTGIMWTGPKKDEINQYTEKEHLIIGRTAKFGGEMLENVENKALRSLQFFLHICIKRGQAYHIWAEIGKLFQAQYKLHKAIFSAFYNITQPNFATLQILQCSL